MRMSSLFVFIVHILIAILLLHAAFGDSTFSKIGYPICWLCYNLFFRLSSKFTDRIDKEKLSSSYASVAGSTIIAEISILALMLVQHGGYWFLILGCYFIGFLVNPFFEWKRFMIWKKSKSDEGNQNQPKPPDINLNKSD